MIRITFLIVFLKKIDFPMPQINVPKLYHRNFQNILHLLLLPRSHYEKVRTVKLHCHCHWLSTDRCFSVQTVVKKDRKPFDFDNYTTPVKTYFHIPKFTIWQVKDFKERNNFILSTTFRSASFPFQNEFEKCTTKTRICNGKSYIKKLYTRLLLHIPLRVLAQLRTATQPHFR